MDFKPVQTLDIHRTLSSSEVVFVGRLAQNRQGVFFQYDENYIRQFGNLSPFSLHEDLQLQQSPPKPHQGIHGVFGDSLPDGWGLLLQDRIFRQQGILPTQITAMDRLAFVGHQGMGALSFTPISDFSPDEDSAIDIAALGLEAQALFDQTLSGDLDSSTHKVLTALVAAGSSGGARPKAQIYMAAGDTSHCRTRAKAGDEAWLIKFTSKNLPLGHEEGLCEAVYLQMAERAQCQPPSWQLIEAPACSGAAAWLAVKRFDYLANANAKGTGRLHMHSACGLLDADFRSPSLDYLDLIKASRQLCQSPAAGQLQFRRAIFNLFAANQDDHSKNWAFLQQDDASWQPAPFYDVTFSPHPFNEHATAFAGHGKKPPLKTMQKLAASAGLASWKDAKNCIKEVLEAIDDFEHLAKQHNISKGTQSAITKTLLLRKKENAELITR